MSERKTSQTNQSNQSSLKRRYFDNLEYNALRAEILNSITLQNNYIIAMYTIAITIIVFAIEQKNAILLLLPYIVIFPFQYTINAKRNNMIKIGVYIREFLEDDMGWEHINIIITHKVHENRKKNNKVKYLIDKFFRRNGATQLGFICSLGACILHISNLKISLIQIPTISLKDTIIFFAAIGLFGCIFTVNKLIWKVDNTQNIYVDFLKDIKKGNNN